MKQKSWFVSDMYLEKWSEASLFTRWGMTVLLWVGAFFGWMFFIHAPLFYVVKIQQEEAKDFYKRVRHIAQCESDCITLQESISCLKQTVFARKFDIPLHQSIMSITQQMERSGLGLHVYQMNKQSALKKEWYQTQRVHFAFTGNVSQIAHFYAYLKDAVSLCMIKNIKMERIRSQDMPGERYRVFTDISIVSIQEKSPST